MNDTPNVILCTCDQLRAFEVGCYGHPVVNTPNIDRLAADGTRFEHAISNNPVCVPARSALITGQYSRTCAGRLDNAYADDGPVFERSRLRDTTIAELFRDAGYRTALIGKWHMGPHPLVTGFDEALFPLVPHRYTGQTYFRNRDDGFVVPEFGPTYESGEVRTVLSKERDRPFFLYYNISLPHQPVMEGIPNRYTSMYSRDDVELRPNTYTDGEMSRSEFWFKVYLYSDYFWEWLADKRSGAGVFDGSGFPLPREDFDLRDLAALYYGATTCVDDMVGGLMDALEDTGRADDTIIVFISDHGDNLGSHDSYNKGQLIEESLRVPLVIRDPRCPAVQSTVQVAQTIDVYPTLASLAGLAVPPSVQGRDLSPVVRGQASVVEPNHVFSETSSGMIGVRTLDRLYAMQLGEDLNTIENRCALHFDIANDPYEENNRCDSPNEQLSALLEEWHRDTPRLSPPGEPGRRR